MLQITKVEIHRDLFGTPVTIEVSGDISVGVMGDTQFVAQLPDDMKLRFMMMLNEIEKRLAFGT